MAQNLENHRGSHAMIDICNFYGDENKLGNLVFDLMIEAIEQTTMKIVHKHLEILNKDTPPGFSAILSLDSSHISAHAYTSKDIALTAFDCFTCGKTNPLEVLQYIYNELNKQFPDIKCTYEFNHKRFRY
jgi:S-adenosylmethionine decarboxylase